MSDPLKPTTFSIYFGIHVNLNIRCLFFSITPSMKIYGQRMTNLHTSSGQPTMHIVHYWAVVKTRLFWSVGNLGRAKLKVQNT